MARYEVKPHRDKWAVKKVGIFSSSVVRVFDSKQSAIEYVKYLGRNNRASRVHIFQSSKTEEKQWTYKKKNIIKKWNNKM